LEHVPADKEGMTAGVIGRMPRVAVIAAGIALLTGTLGFAATNTLSSSTPPAATPVAAAPEPLVVPDVRKQAYVFAKGTLEQGGFAWRVEGAVPGFAANIVVSQSPEPGARLVPDGAPIIVLRLSRNGAYAQQGLPENVSPYAGKPARLFGVAAVKPKPAAKPRTTAAAKPKPAAANPPAAKPGAATRKPAFVVPGAPAEPRDEILLSARAKQLATWVEKHPKRSRAAVDHWLYQHNWIVTGARFGWADGAEALRTLIAVDARTQKLWGVGGQSERLARRVLAEVEGQSR
jgi:hypothetical protein